MPADVVGRPATPWAEALYGSPAPLLQDCVQGLVGMGPDNGPAGRYRAHQMMKLRLDGLQIGKDVGVIVFKIIKYGGARAVMYELRALVEKSRVVFVGFDDEQAV